ncbi:MAG: phospholipase D-like domain-containing protein [Candidatus Omnitrophica bacterium]|nr:phospholipase D-like domain-containing protein [Candidatus Omnitrophota bacterium]
MSLKNIRKVSLLLIICFNFCFSQYKAIVTPLLNEEYAKNLIDFIKKAKKSIKVIMFETSYYKEYPESISNQILREVVNAKKRGIEVEIILELSKFENIKRKNFEAAKFLAENGIKVYFDRENKTTHSKLLIIDNKYIFIGSHNWNYYALEKNNETSVLIDSEKVADLYIQYFSQIKKECRIFLAPLN